MARESDKTATFKRDELQLPTLVKNVPCMVVVEGASIGKEVRLAEADNIIGRADDAVVSVDDRLVSREHARVIAKDGEYFIVDNGSTNGTFLNNQQVIGRTPLAEGDKVRVGSTVLRFSFHDQVDAEYHRRVYDLITYDELTGLLTLRSFYRELEHELARSKRLGTPLALFMMDVDHFKQVNDTHGHQTGSYVLKEVGRLIRQSLRYNDLAARFGGEEFVAYLPSTDVEAAVAGGERVRRALEEFPFEYDEKRPRVTISVGISIFPGDADGVETLVRRADLALYRAKETGRNRVVSFYRELERSATHKK